MKLKEILLETISAHYEYIESCERDITSRCRAIAVTEALTQQLNANRLIMNEFYSKFFEERKQLFNSANHVLESAIENDDPELAGIAVTVIKMLNEKTPFNNEVI